MYRAGRRGVPASTVHHTPGFWSGTIPTATLTPLGDVLPALITEGDDVRFPEQVARTEISPPS